MTRERERERDREREQRPPQRFFARCLLSIGLLCPATLYLHGMQPLCLLEKPTSIARLVRVVGPCALFVVWCPLRPVSRDLAARSSLDPIMLRSRTESFRKFWKLDGFFEQTYSQRNLDKRIGKHCLLLFRLYLPR